MVDTQGVQEKEGERKALEQAALAEFLAGKGVAAPTVTIAATATKEIGPSQAQQTPQ